VSYHFVSPQTQKIISGNSAHCQRNDLKNTTLPRLGTPVAILYADDTLHIML
jgi:hypothetical protein